MKRMFQTLNCMEIDMDQVKFEFIQEKKKEPTPRVGSYLNVKISYRNTRII